MFGEIYPLYRLSNQVFYRVSTVTMADEHIGALVLIDCGAGLGTYQGRIASVDPSSQTITLEQPLRNGVPYQVPKVTLK